MQRYIVASPSSRVDDEPECYRAYLDELDDAFDGDEGDDYDDYDGADIGES